MVTVQFGFPMVLIGMWMCCIFVPLTGAHTYVM
jgi:hypothetical protein